MAKVAMTMGSFPKATKKTDGVTWPEIIGKERYAMQIYRLQNEAGLSFKEACAVLTPRQIVQSLAEEWEITPEGVYNQQRRGRKKVYELTGNDPKRNEDLMPTDMWYLP